MPAAASSDRTTTATMTAGNTVGTGSIAGTGCRRPWPGCRRTNATAVGVGKRRQAATAAGWSTARRTGRSTAIGTSRCCTVGTDSAGTRPDMVGQRTRSLGNRNRGSTVGTGPIRNVDAVGTVDSRLLQNGG